MRPQYFKHRAIFDYDKNTNDVGFPLPWKKVNEDNHFLFRLYKKHKGQYEELYQHHLKFFLDEYEDATEQEFFNFVKRLITDELGAIANKDRYKSDHAKDRRNSMQLQEFLDYLNTIDRWFIQSEDKETISRQQAEINKLIAENQKLKDDNKKLRELETKDYIDIRKGCQKTLYHLLLQIRDLKMEDGRELVNATTLIIWSKMVVKYFRVDGEEIPLESVKRYLSYSDNADATKYKPIPQKDQLYNIVLAKRRGL